MRGYLGEIGIKHGKLEHFLFGNEGIMTFGEWYKWNALFLKRGVIVGNLKGFLFGCVSGINGHFGWFGSTYSINL